jgi:hypothetical protein
MAYRIRTRKFLNVKGFNTGAYIFAEVIDSTSKTQADEWRWSDITLTLADCDRVVSFDFSVDTPAQRQNSLRKIDLMISTLVEFREALAVEATLAKEKERASKKNS